MARIHCRIRIFRKKRNLTQEELAQKLGISRQSLISLEGEKSFPSLPLAFNIAQIFELPIEFIFGSRTELSFDNQNNHQSLITPMVEIQELEKEIIVRIQLLGVKPQEIVLSINENAVSVQLDREEINFTRTITLPTKVEASQAKADFKDNILTITAPKLDSQKTKTIQLKIN